MNLGTASDLDAWRHYFLHMAIAGAPAGPVLEVAQTFDTEWKARVAAFNAVQETRPEDEALIALANFISERDALVAQYRDQVISINPAIAKEVIEKFKPTMRSTTTRTKTASAPGLLAVWPIRSP